MIDLPEDDNDDEIPLNVAVEDSIYLESLYKSLLPVCLLFQHFVVHQRGHASIQKWMRQHPQEPVIQMFSVQDIVFTLFLLNNYGHEEGWKNPDKDAKTKGKHSGKKKLLGQSNICSSGQQFKDDAAQHWTRDLKNDSVSSLLGYLVLFYSYNCCSASDQVCTGYCMV